jgi:hypothetical protein
MRTVSDPCEDMTHLLPRRTDESWQLAVGAEQHRLHQMASHLTPSFLQQQPFFMFAQLPSTELRSRAQVVGSWMTVSQSGCAPVNSPTTRSER